MNEQELSNLMQYIYDWGEAGKAAPPEYSPASYVYYTTRARYNGHPLSNINPLVVPIASHDRSTQAASTRLYQKQDAIVVRIALAHSFQQENASEHAVANKVRGTGMEQLPSCFLYTITCMCFVPPLPTYTRKSHLHLPNTPV